MKDADIFKHGGEVLYGHWAGLLVIGLFMISVIYKKIIHGNLSLVKLFNILINW